MMDLLERFYFKNIFRVLILGFFFCAQFASAQEDTCGKKNFNEIDEVCIRNFIEKKSKEEGFKPEKENAIQVLNNVTNNVYFYKTQRGNLGKFRVISIRSLESATPEEKKKKNLECVVYFDATTFTQTGSYTPNNILSIRSDFGVWQEDQTGLDKNTFDDLRLVRDKNAENEEFCFLYNNTKQKTQLFLYKKMSDTSDLFASYGNKGWKLHFVSLILIFIAVIIIALTVLNEESRFKASETLEEAEIDKKQVSNDFVLKYSRPFFKRYFTPIVNGMRGRQNLKGKYKRRLATGGLSKELTPEDFFAFKLFLIIGFPVIFILLRAGLEETWPLKLVPILGVVGFFYPDIWLSGKIDQRKEEIIRSMPFIVDMLALSVEAGLDFMAAIQKVIEKAPRSALVEEFETLIRETKIGSSRSEGLRQLSWRTDVISINSFCATLIAADSVGASIGPILKQLSTEIRGKRSSEVEKKGATAATKILFPMILFIMPAVFVAIASPLIFQFLSGNK